jgi:DNA-nicking Smr family endonuclease
MSARIAIPLTPVAYIVQVMTDGHELPIDGTLDLHTFAPRDVKSLVPDYIAECRARGIYQLRIIHGKGTGTLREIVRGVLAKHPDVVSYRHEGGSGGSWGATIVDLAPANRAAQDRNDAESHEADET